MTKTYTLILIHLVLVSSVNGRCSQHIQNEVVQEFNSKYHALANPSISQELQYLEVINSIKGWRTTNLTSCKQKQDYITSRCSSLLEKDSKLCKLTVNQKCRVFIIGLQNSYFSQDFFSFAKQFSETDPDNALAYICLLYDPCLDLNAKRELVGKIITSQHVDFHLNESNTSMYSIWKEIMGNSTKELEQVDAIVSQSYDSVIQFIKDQAFLLWKLRFLHGYSGLVEDGTVEKNIYFGYKYFPLEQLYLYKCKLKSPDIYFLDEIVVFQKKLSYRAMSKVYTSETPNIFDYMASDKLLFDELGDILNKQHERFSELGNVVSNCMIELILHPEKNRDKLRLFRKIAACQSKNYEKLLSIDKFGYNGKIHKPIETIINPMLQKEQKIWEKILTPNLKELPEIIGLEVLNR